MKIRQALKIFGINKHNLWENEYLISNHRCINSRVDKAHTIIRRYIRKTLHY